MSELVHKYDISNKGGKASIKIVGDIDWWSNDSKSFTRLIDDLIAKGITDVEGYLNSPGGQMFEGNEIANQIRRFTGERKVVLGALVASAATNIALAFNEVVASKNTQFMIHDPLLYVRVDHLEVFDSSKKMYENLRNQAIEEYAAKTKLDKEELSEMMRLTTWMNASEAKEKGFVDSILETTADLPENAISTLNRLNLSIPENVIVQMKATDPKKQTNRDMKQIIAHLGLAENTTEEAVISVIKNLQDTAKNALTDFAKSKNMDQVVIDTLMKGDPATMLTVVNALPVATTATTNTSAENTTAPTNQEITNNKIIELLEKNLTGSSASNSDKTWDDLTAKEREDLHNTNPEAFDKLFTAKFPK